MKITLQELRRIIREEIEVLAETTDPKSPPIEGPQYPGKYPGQVVTFSGVRIPVRKMIPIINKFTGKQEFIPIKVEEKNDIVFIWDGKNWNKQDPAAKPKTTPGVSTTTPSSLKPVKRERPPREEPPVDPRDLGKATVIRRRRGDDGKEDIMPVRTDKR